MPKEALLIVDVQTALIKANPYNKKNVIDNIKTLISISRESGKEVIYIRHNIDKNNDDIKDKEWQIYEEVTPDSNETIFNKRYNSAFYKTGLRQYLESKGIDTIILMGLQTEYCVDTTCKVAFEYGYKVIIPEETNTTFDNEYLAGRKMYELYNHKIWNKRFAHVIPVSEVIRILEGTKKF